MTTGLHGQTMTPITLDDGRTGLEDFVHSLENIDFGFGFSAN